MRIKLFLLVFILIGGCISLPIHKNKFHNNTINLLSNDSVKYWFDAWKIPYFPDYKEGGFAIFKNGNLLNYRLNYENKRVIVDNSSNDIFCEPPSFKLKSDKFYLKNCGTTFIFKIVKLNEDTLQLKELTKYNYFEDTIPIIYVKSKNQITRPIEGDLINPDPDMRPVKAMPVIK